jgi:hypothetical protein
MPELPKEIARRWIMDAVHRKDVGGLRRAFACTADRGLIDEAGETLTRKLFEHAVRHTDSERFTERARELFTALMQAQLEHTPMLAPPVMALHLYRERRAAMQSQDEIQALDRATAMLLDAMRAPSCSFATTVNENQSLLLFAIRDCGCGEPVLESLRGCDCGFLESELSSDTARAELARRPRRRAPERHVHYMA